MGKNEGTQVQPDNKYYKQLVKDITKELNDPKIINLVIAKLVFFEQLGGLTLPYQDTKGIREVYSELKERIKDAKKQKNINKVIRALLTSLTNSYIFAVKMQDEETENKIREIFQQYGYDITKFKSELIGSSEETINDIKCHRNGYFIPTETHRSIRIDVYRHFGFCNENQSIKSIKSIREMWEELLPLELLPENPNELPNIYPGDLLKLESIAGDEGPQIGFTPLMEKIIEKATKKTSDEDQERKPLSLKEIIDKIIALCKRYKLYQAPDPTMICSKQIGPFQIIPNMGILEMLLVSPHYDTVSERYEKVIEYILKKCKLSEEDGDPSKILTLEEIQPEDATTKPNKRKRVIRFGRKKKEND